MSWVIYCAMDKTWLSEPEQAHFAVAWSPHRADAHRFVDVEDAVAAYLQMQAGLVGLGLKIEEVP